MINGAENNLVGKVAGGAFAPRTGATGPSSGASFADALKGSIDEVSRLQQDASKAVEGLTTGKSDDPLQEVALETLDSTRFR